MKWPILHTHARSCFGPSSADRNMSFAWSPRFRGARADDQDDADVSRIAQPFSLAQIYHTRICAFASAHSHASVFESKLFAQGLFLLGACLCMAQKHTRTLIQWARRWWWWWWLGANHASDCLRGGKTVRPCSCLGRAGGWLAGFRMCTPGWACLGKHTLSPQPPHICISIHSHARTHDTPQMRVCVRTLFSLKSA